VLDIPEHIEINIINKMEDEPTAELDRDQFSQVLLNLINNAVDAMLEVKSIRHKLELSIDGDKENVFIAVKDTGAGIPEKYINKIFDPFFTTKEIGKGTGLGLPVSYGIIKMHSGEIKVESNSDITKGETGTTVTVNLPRSETRYSVSKGF
ncbi:MAG: ATP-binding protein, partial [bacterium]